MPTIAIIYVLIGLLFVGLSIPLILGKVKPNRWYGFRTRQTVENPDIWYPANTYAGWWLLVMGFIIVVVAMAGLFIPNISEDGYVILVTVIMLTGLLLSAVFSVRYAKSLTKE